MAETDENEAQQEAAEQFEIQKIYIKDASFEAPLTPKIFTKEWQPDINLQLGSNISEVADDTQEVVLTITITAKLEEETAYIVEVQQAGIFYAKGFQQDAYNHLMGSYCPSILFPYAREAISDLVTRGGFPQFLLQPINFDAIYAQRLEQQAAKQDEEADVH